MPLPALLTIQSGINQLRYATLKGIMAAKKKEIRSVAAPADPRGEPATIVRPVAAVERSKQTLIIAGTPAASGRRVWCRRLREEARVL